MATSLVLAGCGGDGHSNSGLFPIGTTPNPGTSPAPTPGTNPTPNPITTPNPVVTAPTELDQAKEMIRTAHMFINDGDAVKTAYDNMSDILTAKQQDRLGESLSTAEDIYQYMYDNKVSQLTQADILALKDNATFKDYFYDNALAPSSDFIAKMSADNKFSLEGTLALSPQDIDYVYNKTTKKHDKVVTTADTFSVIYNGFINTLYTNTAMTNPAGNLGFDNITIGSGAERMVLSSATKGVKMQGQFSEAVVYNDDFDFSDAQTKGIRLQKATLGLQDLKLVANDSVMEAKDFEFVVMDISNKLADGTTVVQTVPYKLALTGKLNKKLPMTDVTITLNMTANEADIKNHVLIDKNGDLTEADGKYVGMTVLLAAKGQLTKDNAVVIPLDFQANLKRTGRDVITLESLNASVEGKTLLIEGVSDLKAADKATKTSLTFKQGNAHLALNLNSDNDFIEKSAGKLGDIMVGDKDYGDLYDNNGQITAKFNDNSLIVL